MRLWRDAPLPRHYYAQEVSQARRAQDLIRKCRRQIGDSSCWSRAISEFAKCLLYTRIDDEVCRARTACLQKPVSSNPIVSRKKRRCTSIHERGAHVIRRASELACEDLLVPAARIAERAFYVEEQSALSHCLYSSGRGASGKSASPSTCSLTINSLPLTSAAPFPAKVATGFFCSRAKR